jgi:hypothetical protein
MRALVVYESMFGNTQRIAEAIAAGISSRMNAEAVEVTNAPTSVEVDLLVVGGPTHAFGMTREGTRKQAAEQAGAGLVSRGEGIREWLAHLDLGALRPAAATFDTCFRKARLLGTASKAIAKRLRRLGLSTVTDAEHFFVSGSPGPLLPGEEERARRWGEQVAAVMAAPARR